MNGQSSEASTLDLLQKIIDRLDRQNDLLLFDQLGSEKIINFFYQDVPIKLAIPDALRDKPQGNILRHQRFFEQNLLGKVKNEVSPAELVVDVGANIGNHTVFFSKVCDVAGVIAIEPQPYVFSILERNIKINELKNVNAYNCLLGDKNGRAEVKALRPGNLGATSFKQSADGGFNVATLDSLLESVDQRIGFIKIDVEGMQQEVLAGAKETIITDRPILWVEMIEAKGEIEETKPMLEALGYRIEKISKNDFLCHMVSEV